MQRVTKTIDQWQKHVDEYKKISEKLQKRITRTLRTIWLNSEDYKKCDVEKMIEYAGTMTPVQKTLRKIILISEKFSCSAEEELLSATMKLDDIMSGLDEFLRAPPTKRKKVGLYFFIIQLLHLYYTFLLHLQVDIVFNDEPEDQEISNDIDDSDMSDSDATDVSDEYTDSESD